jgi:hypothetical protein
MSDKQVEVSKEYIERLWNNKDISALDDLCTEDYRVEPLWSNFMIPPEAIQIDDGVGTIDRDVAKRIVGIWLTVLPDLQMTTDDVIAGDDKVMTLHSATVHELGPVFGEAPRELEREGTVRAILIEHFRPGEDRIYKTNTFWDFWHILLATDSIHAAYRFLGSKIPDTRVPA